MSIATMMATLKLNISDFASKLDVASSKLTKFASKTQSDYGKATTALKSHNLGLKDTARIVQGIVISQAFYAGANAIARATSALWSFNKELDYAKITYSALFGSTDIANKFSTVLQEHAVETIFDYQQLSNVSKKLLAYGIEYKNLMYVMEGMTNLGAMSGDAQAMDRIALALGQIKTTGYLTATEMRQLANAYVPIYDIVQNAFGLSGDQMQSIGDLKLPAHEVINAVVDYANERFGAVGDAATHTITGLENRIVDTLKIVGSAMIAPITTAYKSMLVYISSGLEELRSAYNTGGLGGVFEFLVPDENMQTTIRQFIANVRNLLMSLASVATVAGNLFGNFAHVVVTAFNIIAPVISNFLNVLSAVVNAMLQNSQVAAILRVALVAAAGAFVLLRVQAAAALVITAVTKAVTTLSGALLTLANIIVKHPIISLLFALGVSLVGISVASDKANKGISGVFDSLSDVGGISSKDVLQPVKNGLSDSADAAAEFNKRLEEGAGAANDLTEAIGGSGKAAKKTKEAVGLLSFDEVFKLPEKTDSSGGGGSGGGAGTGLVDALTDLKDTFGGLGDSLIPEIPDFSDYLSAFTDSLFGGLGESITSKLKSLGIGSLIGTALGGIIGGIFGGPAGVKLGMQIGAFAGAFVGLIFDEIKYAINNTGTGLISGIWGTISKALAAAGATGLGSIVKNAFSNGGGLKGVLTALGGVLKSTGAKSLIKGGLLGAAVGLVTDVLAHLLWTTLDKRLEGTDVEAAKVGQTIGGLIGTAVGAFFGPVGALIGSAAGTLIGGLVGLFWEPISEFFKDLTTKIAEWMSVLLSTVDKWWNKSGGIGEWLDTTWQGISTWWTDTLAGFSTWCADTWSLLTGWISDSTGGFSEWWNNTWSSVSSWWQETIALFSDWDSITGDTLRQWLSDTATGIRTWWTDTTSSFNSWVSDTTDKFTTWWNDTTNGFSNWRTNTSASISTWWSDTKAKFSEWSATTIASFNSWWDRVSQGFINWKSNIVSSVTSWVADTFTKITTWIADTASRFHQWSQNVLQVFVGFHIAAAKAVSQWLSDTLSSITGWFSNTATSIRNLWRGLFDVNSWVSGWTHLKRWFDDLLANISGWFGGIKNTVSGWWDDLWDGKKAPSVTGNSSSGARLSMAGHATGGVFNREHVARFAEGNKAEAIIPLENSRAMQPFVDAVSGGLVSSLAPIVASINAGGSNNLPPLYVGTLIADDRGIKQLYDKFEVIRLQESDRRGTSFA